MGKACHIVDASRAAGLAVHSAASLAVSSSKETARLLRAAEGLVRSATAVLMAAQDSTDSAARRVSSPGLGEDSGQHAGKGNGRGKRSKSRAGRRDWKCSACSAHCFGSKAACYKRGAARPSVASADAKMAAESGGDGFDDSWADSCRRGPASAGALDDSKDAVTEVVDAAPTGAWRQLVARGSRERSPQRSPCSSGTKFHVGAHVTLHDLTSRFELNGATGVVMALPSGEDVHRLSVLLDGKNEQIRVKDSNLKLVVTAPNIFS